MPLRCRPHFLRLFYRSHSTSTRFQAVQDVRSIDLELFRENYFNVGAPVVLRKLFTSTPAISRWFKYNDDNEKTWCLNDGYLSPYGDSIMPLELTRLAPNSSSSTQSDFKTTSFERLEAPLSVFLSSISSPEDDRTRLYLAQCSLDSLPATLQSDLPTPGIVLRAGKGDIYSSSVWMGRSPTRTPLHRDPNPNLFVQLAGRKIVRLMEPRVGRGVYEHASAGGGHANLRGEEMMVGHEMDCLEDAVWGEESNAKGWEATVDSGDGLFIPLGWWHSVRGIGKGVTGSVNWWFR